MIVKTIVHPHDTPEVMFIVEDSIKPSQLKRYKSFTKKNFRKEFIVPKFTFITFEEESDYDEV